MDRDERLALAVRAEVAGIRADETRERSELLRRQVAPIDRVVNEYQRLYGSDADPAAHPDVWQTLMAHHGGGRVPPEAVDAAVSMVEECALADAAVAAAMRTVTAAMGRDDSHSTLLAWVGCSVQEYKAAIQAALAEV